MNTDIAHDLRTINAKVEKGTDAQGLTYRVLVEQNTRRGVLAIFLGKRGAWQAAVDLQDRVVKTPVYRLFDDAVAAATLPHLLGVRGESWDGTWPAATVDAEW